MEKIVVLTGAGISAESGLATFRGSDGLWENERVEDVASPEAFVRNPEKVHRFYNERRRHVLAAEPNAAHIALARLEDVVGQNFNLITQNIDTLHEHAGSRAVIHMHGDILHAFCISCKTHVTVEYDMSVNTICPECMKASTMRPDIVWFGEFPYYMEKIDALLAECSMFISIGTSGTVYPAAGFAMRAKNEGAKTIILNKESIDINTFDQHIYGNATEIVPEWVEQFLEQRNYLL